MLIEHQPITFDDFNHKKRHGLLELSRDAMRGIDRDSRSHEPNAPLTRLRMKLQKNLVILQTHLDAVGTIAVIIARAMHDMNPMAPIRWNLAKKAAFDDAANCQLHLHYRRYFGFSLCEPTWSSRPMESGTAVNKAGDLVQKKRRLLMFQ
jgi:hypothetical protein